MKRANRKAKRVRRSQHEQPALRRKASAGPSPSDARLVDIWLLAQLRLEYRRCA